MEIQLGSVLPLQVLQVPVTTNDVLCKVDRRSLGQSIWTVRKNYPRRRCPETTILATRGASSLPVQPNKLIGYGVVALFDCIILYHIVSLYLFRWPP